MKTKRKPVIGEILFSLNVGNAARNREQTLTPVQVVSVARKYFICRQVGESAWSDVQYHIDSWWENTEYSANSTLYENEHEWVEEKQAKELFNKVKHSFSGYQNNFTLDQLRRIDAILMEK